MEYLKCNLVEIYIKLKGKTSVQFLYNIIFSLLLSFTFAPFRHIPPSKPTTTLHIPRRSPIQVLTQPKIVYLQRSDENGDYQLGMAIDIKISLTGGRAMSALFRHNSFSSSLATSSSSSLPLFQSITFIFVGASRFIGALSDFLFSPDDSPILLRLSTLLQSCKVGLKRESLFEILARSETRFLDPNFSPHSR